jgi:hypothetical protein
MLDMKYNIKYKLCGPLCVCLYIFTFTLFPFPLCNGTILYSSVRSCIVIFRWHIEVFCCFFDVTVVLTLI